VPLLGGAAGHDVAWVVPPAPLTPPIAAVLLAALVPPAFWLVGAPPVSAVLPDVAPPDADIAPPVARVPPIPKLPPADALPSEPEDPPEPEVPTLSLLPAHATAAITISEIVIHARIAYSTASKRRASTVTRGNGCCSSYLRSWFGTASWHNGPQVFPIGPSHEATRAQRMWAALGAQELTSFRSSASCR
jgi:hypothetical protein